jgi:hypothetical protein
MRVVYCQLEVSVTARSFVQTSPTNCRVSECGLETSSTGRSRRTRTVEP